MGRGSLAPEQAAGTKEGADQYLAFTLNSEVFAIDILRIREIIEYSQLTEVPLMPATVRGVINLRGAVVPVIDLSVRLGKPPMTITRRTVIVIAETIQDDSTQVLGMMVDAVNAVIEIPDHDIEPAPSFGMQMRSEFIAGMGKLKEQFVIMLDVAQVLSVHDLATVTLGE